MARLADPALKLELLDRVVAYLGAHGLGAASLRPIAKEIGTSLNRLVHHFGSKEELLGAAVRRANDVQVQIEAGWVARQPDISNSEVLRKWWRWMNASPSNLAAVRLIYEAATIDATISGLERQVQAEQIGVWREHIEHRLVAAGVPPRQARSEATVIKATFTGFIIELLATGERRRLTAILNEWLDASDTRVKELVAVATTVDEADDESPASPLD